MVKWLLITFLPFQLLADYPVYHISKNKLKINRDSFFRYIKPQAKNIVQDYFYVLKNMGEHHQELISFRHEINQLKVNWNKVNITCPTILTKDCFVGLKKLYTRSKKLDKMLISFEYKRSRNKDDPEKDLYGHQLDSILVLNSIIFELSNMTYTLNHYLEELIILTKTPYAIYHNAREKIPPLLHQLLLKSEMAMTYTIDSQFREEFDAVWTHFIKNIEQQITFRSNSKYLLNRLAELNLAWNSFHMKVAKGNVKLDKKLLKMVQTMHSRWNSILKIVLR